jgi:hypothetical protein
MGPPSGRFNVPKLVAVPVCQYEVGQLSHDGLGRCVHKIKRISIVWLDKLVLGGKSDILSDLEAGQWQSS